MLSLFRYLSVTSVTTFGNWDSSSARFARRRTLGKISQNVGQWRLYVSWRNTWCS